jgi:hypothetical protein
VPPPVIDAIAQVELAISPYLSECSFLMYSL